MKNLATGVLNMEFDDATEIRTKRITKISWAIIVLLVFLSKTNAEQSITYTEQIDFDDVETLWLKNVAVQLLPIGSVRDQSVPMLKLTGLAAVDIEDGVRIKPTLSPTNCLGNETDLQIVNDAPSKNSIDRTNGLIVSLSNFDFKRQPTAYLCIKTKYDHLFQHMGTKSKFLK